MQQDRSEFDHKIWGVVNDGFSQIHQTDANTMKIMCRRAVEQRQPSNQKQHCYLGSHPCLVHSIVFRRYAVHGCHPSRASSCDCRLFRSVLKAAESALATRAEVEVALGSWP